MTLFEFCNSVTSVIERLPSIELKSFKEFIGQYDTTNQTEFFGLVMCLFLIVFLLVFSKLLQELK